MHLKKSLFIFICLLSTLLYAEQTTLQKQMADIMKNFKTAALTGDDKKVKMYASSRLIETMRNNLASAGITMSSEHIKGMAENVDFPNGVFNRSFENGPTVGIVYSKYDPDNNKQVLFQFTKFVKESDGWKYDGAFELYTAKIDSTGKKPVFTEKDIPEQLTLDGVVKGAPSAAALSEYPASIFIFGSGYKITLRVNDGEPVVCNEGSISRQLSGGLKKGVNTIELDVVKQPAKTDMYPSIEVKYLDKSKQEKTAFSVDEKAMKTGKWSETFQIE
jgi:hypothetical protein